MDRKKSGDSASEKGFHSLDASGNIKVSSKTTANTCAVSSE
jgi:hypothetical protein